ncbi:MAG: PAS domain-containing protein, partial [Myxococcales bacterium]|nr:PAS domain-containing protein [Myxococcales bacterium]
MELRHFARLSQDLICVAETAGYFQWLSPRWSESLGYSLDELMARPLLEFVHPSDLAATALELEKLGAGIPMINFENRCRIKGGGYRWLQWGATPQGDTFYAIARDITELKEMRQRSEQQVRLLLLAEEVADLSHWTFEVESQSVHWGARICKMLGRPAESTCLAEKRALGPLHPDDREPFLRAMRQAIQSRGNFELEARMVRADGGELRTLIRGRSEQSSEGRVERIFGIVQDVTETHRMRSQLARSVRMASVGTLAAGMAHQINNPLSMVMTNLDHLAEELHRIGGASPPAHIDCLAEAIREALEGAQRIRRVVRGLRVFARADEERNERIDLTHLLETCVQMCANEIRHRATLIRDLDAVPQVRGDSARLAQVFVNLLVNAAQALPAGAADQARIHLRCRTDALGWAEIEVEDTGPGIPGDCQERIFDPFFTTKPVGVGTGLGLSLALGVVEGLGGELTLEPGRGGGACFRVRLPPLDADAELLRLEAPPRLSKGRPRLLIVDDEALVRAALRRILRRSYEIELAEDGIQAIEKLQAGEPFDLILCDLMMPVMTGMALHARLREQMPEMARRMVFLTGGTFTPSGRDFLSAVDAPRVEK